MLTAADTAGMMDQLESHIGMEASAQQYHYRLLVQSDRIVEQESRDHEFAKVSKAADNITTASGPLIKELMGQISKYKTEVARWNAEHDMFLRQRRLLYDAITAAPLVPELLSKYNDTFTAHTGPDANQSVVDLVSNTLPEYL